MNILKTSLYAITLLSANTAFADQCPDYLPINLMSDCVVETGAGSDYKAEQKYAEWRKIQVQKLNEMDNYSGPTITSASNSKHI